MNKNGSAVVFFMKPKKNKLISIHLFISIVSPDHVTLVQASLPFFVSSIF